MDLQEDKCLLKKPQKASKMKQLPFMALESYEDLLIVASVVVVLPSLDISSLLNNSGRQKYLYENEQERDFKSTLIKENINDYFGPQRLNFAC